MRAVVLEGRGALAVRELPDPVAGPGEVLLRVRACSVCGSDVGRFVRGHRTYPLVLGHEAAGEIVAAGEGADPALVGRRAALVPLVPCHACSECRAGRFSACGSYSFVGSRRDGAFAELVALPAANVLPLPDDLPFEVGALVEPSSVAVHLLELAGPLEGAGAVVLGAGGIGLLLVRWLRLRGAGPVVAVEPRADGREAAAILGADLVLDPAASDLAAAVGRLLPGGADLVLEASGAPSALAATLELVRPRGTVVLAGNQPEDASLPMTFVERLIRREVRLTGGFMSYSAPWPGGEWRDSLAAAVEGRLATDTLISHRLPLSTAPATFRAIEEGRLTYRKIVFDPSG